MKLSNLLKMMRVTHLLESQQCTLSEKCTPFSVVIRLPPFTKESEARVITRSPRRDGSEPAVHKLLIKTRPKLLAGLPFVNRLLDFLLSGYDFDVFLTTISRGVSFTLQILQIFVVYKILLMGNKRKLICDS